jgi:hypothetical protein
MPARFQVFLSHNSADKPAVEDLAHRLRKEGLEPWLDKWHLIPGDPWQPALEDALQQCGPRTVGLVLALHVHSPLIAPFAPGTLARPKDGDHSPGLTRTQSLRRPSGIPSRWRRV